MPCAISTESQPPRNDSARANIASWRRDIVRVEHLAADTGAATHGKVGGNRRQPRLVARDEIERVTPPGKNARRGLRDCRRGADDQYFSHASSVTRRQKLEEQAGSMYCENSCQRG